MQDTTLKHMQVKRINYDISNPDVCHEPIVLLLISTNSFY